MSCGIYKDCIKGPKGIKAMRLRPASTHPSRPHPLPLHLPKVLYTVSQFFEFLLIEIRFHLDLLGKGYDLNTKKLQIKSKSADGVVSFYCIVFRL